MIPNIFEWEGFVPSPTPTPVSVTVVSQPAPVLPLDEFRRIVGYHPFHFWGLANSGMPVTSACNTILAEHSYQSANMAGRDEIRDALLTAEQRLTSELEYCVAPRYIEYTIPYPLYYDMSRTRILPFNAQGLWVGVLFPEGYVQAIGVEALTLLDTVAVTYSAQAGAGVNDTFTISVNTTETDPNKIAVYFASADRLDNELAGERWRIQPLNISISGGVATIKGRAWLLVKPILYEGYTQAETLDPSDSSNFVTTLEVYIRTTNPDGTTVSTSQGRFNWETLPYPAWASCCNVSNPSATDPASTAYAIARVGIRDMVNGILIPGQALFNESTDSWYSNYPVWGDICRPPQSVTIRAYAGYPLEANGRMNERFQRMVAYMALAELAERMCSDGIPNKTIFRYQEEMTKSGTPGEQFAITRAIINNPFGNRRGHWYAWNECQDLKLHRGASA